MKLPSCSSRENAPRRQRRLAFEQLFRRELLAVDLVAGADGASFIDLGHNPMTGQVVMVGTEEVEGVDVAKVFKLNEQRTAITSETLIGLGPDTQVFGISSDGTRVAGVSRSPGSVDVGEGTTWLSAAPDSPVGIGFVDGKPKTSNAVGAWAEGVVEQFNGGDGALRWSESAGIEILGGNPGDLQEAGDVSADGNIQVGFSSLDTAAPMTVF